MEYLPLPQEIAFPHIEVTFSNPAKYWYQAEWDEYKEGIYWNNFPKHYGYRGGEFWNDSSTYSNKAWANAGFHAWLMQKSREELEGMAIGWLFFGTLAEVTCCYLDISYYLDATDDGRFILKLTEKSMDALLERWFTIQTHFKGSTFVRGIPEPVCGVMMDHEARLANRDGIQTLFDTAAQHDGIPITKLNALGKSQQFERAYRCLQRSKAIIGFLCEAIDTKSVFVISSLHEFLAKALTTIVFKGEVAETYESRGFDLGSWTGGADFTHYNREILKTLKWCPRTAAQFWREGSRTLAVDFFGTNLKSSQTNEDHSKCSEDMCVAYQLDPEKYKVAHAPDQGRSCSCSHLHLDPEIASAVLSSDTETFPLVTIPMDGGDEMSIEVLDAVSDPSFVAISHVWSHGMGNPKQNSLPRCQLQRIQNYVNELASQADTHQKPMPFWMDTLCCPLEPKESRRTAIMRMRSTYERASKVLVLDRNLCSLSTRGISKLEQLMQIYRTTWMTRLWTLQEARLAKQVWFQFKDKAVNLENLSTQFRQERLESASKMLSKELFQGFLFGKLDGLRSFKYEVPTSYNKRSIDTLFGLHTLMAGLGGRSTSWASDEAICISTLMDLDLKPILDFPSDDPDCASLRMTAMWKQWPVVPSGIIFNKAPRLTQKGYRWAQSTFIRTSHLGFPVLDINTVATVDPKGEGLIVSMQGFTLQSIIPVELGRSNIGIEKLTDPTLQKQSGTLGLGTRPTCIIYDISKEIYKWYDLQIDGPVYDTATGFEYGDEFAILFSEEVNPGNILFRQKSALLGSIRKTDNGTIYIHSLYHVKVARSEAPVEKMFAAGLKVREILSRSGIEPYPTMKLDLSKAVSRQDFAELKSIITTALDDVAVMSYNIATILKNKSPQHLVWVNSSEERRKDWNTRASIGDVAVFMENTVNIWLCLSSPVVALSKSQKWCVD